MKTNQWIRGGLLLSALIFAGTVFAQSEPTPRRGETGEAPLPGSGGGMSPWSFVNITGQSRGSTLGALTVDAFGGVYVWSMRREYWPVADEGEAPTPRRIEPGTPILPGGEIPLLPDGEGGFYPTPEREGTGEAGGNDNGGGDTSPTPGIMMSTLFYGGDAGWMTELELTGETGASVFVDPSGGDVYAATDLPDGSVRVYRHHEGLWSLEPLPAGVMGPAGAFVGEEDVYFRTGWTLLRRVSGQWTVEMACDEMPMSGGLMSLGLNQIMVTCEGHDHVFNGSYWSDDSQTLPTHVHGLWGGRDELGELHLFGAGTCAEHCFLRIFHFTETMPGTLTGDFHIDLEDPLPANPWPGSYANRAWGSGVHDVYVTGVARSYGHLYRFDGDRWWLIDPMPNLPATLDVSGTPWGALWVSLADGRLLHRHADMPLAMPASDPPVSMPGLLPEVAVAAPATADLIVRSGPNGTAAMEFSLPEEQQVTLTVFDLAGRRVETLRQERLRAGVHQLTWNAARVPSGIYFCRFEAGPVQLTKRVLIHR